MAVTALGMGNKKPREDEDSWDGGVRGGEINPTPVY